MLYVAKPKIFTTWSLTEKVRLPLLSLSTWILAFGSPTPSLQGAVNSEESLNSSHSPWIEVRARVTQRWVFSWEPPCSPGFQVWVERQAGGRKVLKHKACAWRRSQKTLRASDIVISQLPVNVRTRTRSTQGLAHTLLQSPGSYVAGVRERVPRKGDRGLLRHNLIVYLIELKSHDNESKCSRTTCDASNALLEIHREETIRNTKRVSHTAVSGSTPREDMGNNTSPKSHQMGTSRSH